jgi:tetratricopeptide (TPR) repeat protein
MADETTEDIALWLQQGLDAYGVGDTETAIRVWRRVLEADPQNSEALDFLDTAERREFPRGEEGEDAIENDVAADANADVDLDVATDVAIDSAAIARAVEEGDCAEVADLDILGEARQLIAAEQYEESSELLRQAATTAEFSLEL